jgi:hypothetical protein
MSDHLERLTCALADRYTVEHELAPGRYTRLIASRMSCL